MTQPFFNDLDFFKSYELDDHGFLLKSKALPIGHITTLRSGRKVKKVAAGKWLPVAEGGEAKAPTAEGEPGGLLAILGILGESQINLYRVGNQLAVKGQTIKYLDYLRQVKRELKVGLWNPQEQAWMFPIDKLQEVFSGLHNRISKAINDLPEEASTAEETVLTTDAIKTATIRDNPVIGNQAVTADGKEGEVVAVNAVVTPDGVGQPVVTIQLKGGEQVTTDDATIKPETDDAEISKAIESATPETRAAVNNKVNGGRTKKGKKAETTAPTVDAAVPAEISFTPRIRKYTLRNGMEIDVSDYTGLDLRTVGIPRPKAIKEFVATGKLPQGVLALNEDRMRSYRNHSMYVPLPDGNFLVPNTSAKISSERNGKIYQRALDLSDLQNQTVRGLPAGIPAAYIVPAEVIAATEYFYSKVPGAQATAHNEKMAADFVKVRPLLDLPEVVAELAMIDPGFNGRTQRKKVFEKVKEQHGLSESVSTLLDMYALHQALQNVQNDPALSATQRAAQVKKQYQYYLFTKVPSARRYKASSVYYSHKNGISELSTAYTTSDAVRQLQQRIYQTSKDMEIQQEFEDNTHSKGEETAYGDSNLNSSLLDDYGVNVKRQNGAVITKPEIAQLKEALDYLAQAVGSKKEMSKEFGLKISHSGDVLMHARKAVGLYFPHYKAIGVSFKERDKAANLTLVHEYGHFMDNYLGSRATNNKRNYVSEDTESVAGRIADTFRRNMIEKQESKYQNRTCECFARAFEQYVSLKNDGKHINSDNYCKPAVFEQQIKPLFDALFEQHKDVLKSASIKLAFFK